MHPILQNWKASLPYMAAWVPLGAILGLLISVAGQLSSLKPNTKDTWIAVLLDGARIPVSRGGYARFHALIGGQPGG
jgi:hypothetical protein